MSKLYNLKNTSRTGTECDISCGLLIFSDQICYQSVDIPLTFYYLDSVLKTPQLQLQKYATKIKNSGSYFKKFMLTLTLPYGKESLGAYCNPYDYYNSHAKLLHITNHMRVINTNIEINKFFNRRITRR